MCLVWLMRQNCPRGWPNRRAASFLGSDQVAFDVFFFIHKKIYIFFVQNTYICQECETDLSRSRNLNRHERTHTGKKPYQCPKCGTGFSRSIYLNLHEHTHTGEKPYQCKESEYFFSQRTNLKDYTSKLLLWRNFKNTISVEHDFQGLVLSNYKHSYGRETIQMLRVWSRVFKKQ